MRQVLAEQWGSFAIAYLDDIVIYSANWEEHLTHLGLVLERLAIYGLTVAPKKCCFGKTSLPYLGHIVGTGGNTTQPVHIEAIRNAPAPRNSKALRSFIGLCNWVKEYIPNSSEILAPLTNMLSTKRPFKWTNELQEKFERAKLAFQNPQSLSRPDPNLTFVLQTDASAKGMGAVLMQEGLDGKRRIISFASAKFSDTESRHHCNEQECSALIWAIKRYRPYLEDAPFILRTDSKTLTWLDTRKDTRDKLHRWYILLREFAFTIEHVPGRDNERPDALSRFPDPNEASPGEPDIQRLLPPFYFWPGMSREIRRYVTGCHLCICCKPVLGKQPDKQRPRAATKAWDTIAVDIMEPYPRTSQDHAYILVVTELFTRWVEAFPMRNAHAPRIIQLLENEVFSRYGYPRRILSDNGPQFTGHLWADASQRWGCGLWTTPIYHPRANPTERRNQEIKKGLRLRLHRGNQRTWDRHLPSLLFGLRRRANAATDTTPSYLLFGQTIPGPGEWDPAEIPEAQQTYQARYTAAPAQPRFTPGDWVYLPNHQLSNKAAGFNAKLAPSRLGPYQVLEHLTGDVYRILKDGAVQKVHGNVLIPAPASIEGLPVQTAVEGLADHPGHPPGQETGHQLAESVGEAPSAESVGGDRLTTAVGETEDGARKEPRQDQRVPVRNLVTGSGYAEPSTGSKARTAAEVPRQVPEHNGAENGELVELSDYDNEDEQAPGQHQDNARRRYNMRRKGPVNYRDGRPYVHQDRR
ncbi:uncharacterized protein LOC117176448 [Belonocnema kinseyi]|uniref:uncharacterized protein LOC117176448 n=1 Tax=Belonocnema kinseyi TaxID=2817044 RepID=UPI00143DCD4B|nr:uncharacterized protein LOC117176448 [Belonocnema kinseyi]